MKISVIIPVYNEKEYIERCLTSLLAQEEAPDEIIVVDNNSTDGTPDLVKKYKIKIVRERKQGMIPARNRGFNSASGDIIARCDADVELPSDWIKKIKHNFRTYPIDALTGPAIFHDFPFGIFFLRVYTAILKRVRRGNDTLSGPNMALKKEIWVKVKDKVCLDDSLVHEDIDLSIHILQAGGRIMRDKFLRVYASARRIRNNPLSFFIDYPIRVIRSLSLHGEINPK